MLRQEEVDVEANLQTQQRKNLKAMKALVRNLKLLPLVAKIKGNGVSVEETNTPKANGRSIEPLDVSAKFRNAIGSIIRTKMDLDPTIPDWPTVPEGRKEVMWQLLSRTFILPRGTQDKVKHYAKKMLGESFRRWKSELNTKYVQKGLTPFADYGDITPQQWEEFVRQKEL